MSIAPTIHHASGWEATVRAAVTADHAGDLDRARALITSSSLGISQHAESEQLATTLRVRSSILRHRCDTRSLEDALGSAENSRRVISLRQLAENHPTRALAELEVAACAIALGDARGLHDQLRRWRRHEHVGISGWSWVLTGKMHLQHGEPIMAVGAFQNAIAEFGRSGQHFRERTARILLADALDRIGRTEEAHTLLSADGASWPTDDVGVRRAGVNYRLALATNKLSRGEIAAALEELSVLEFILDACTGLDHARAAMLALRADCLREWGQHAAATQDRQAAAQLASRPTEAGPRRRAAAVPTPSTVWLGAQGPESPRDHLADQNVRAGANQILQECGDRGVTDEATVLAVVAAMDALRGVAGLERFEARALLRAGHCLKNAKPTQVRAMASLAAERLYRRCMVRSELLAKMQLTRARAEVGLAHVLAGRGDHDALALALVVRGLQTIDEQRFLMRHRAQRRNWLQTEVNPAYELAITLAADQDPELAADLIVFSRAAGIVSPGTEGDEELQWHGDVALAALPRLVYLDGASSRLGGPGWCRYL